MKAIEWNKNPANFNASNQRHGLVANMIKSGNYEDSQIVALFINLIVAGGETPALVCCKTFAAINANPEVLARVIKELDTLSRANDEDLSS